MAREIKFRGKRTDDGEWVYGFYDGCYETATINYLKNGIPYNVCVIPETVGQYTGLEDKNGKESYSGDISIDERGRKWVIIDVPGGFAHVRDIHFNKPMFELVMSSLSDIQNAHHFSRQHEVIGNIWQNPELLEQKP